MWQFTPSYPPHSFSLDLPPVSAKGCSQPTLSSPNHFTQLWLSPALRLENRAQLLHKAKGQEGFLYAQSTGLNVYYMVPPRELRSYLEGTVSFRAEGKVTKLLVLSCSGLTPACIAELGWAGPRQMMDKL